jgi:hypothetical protein
MSNITLIGGRQRLLVIDGTPWFVVADLPGDIRRSDIKSLFGNPASFERGLCCAPVVAGHVTPAVSVEGLTGLLTRISEQGGRAFALLAVAQVFRDQQGLHRMLMDGLWRLDLQSAKANLQADTAKRDTLRRQLSELVGVGAKVAVLEAQCADTEAYTAWLRALPDDVIAALAAQAEPTPIALH